jgi:adenylate cyclase
LRRVTLHTRIVPLDIVGFTAWSSERDAPLVLCLLQNIFRAFDMIAKKRGVFKVDTLADSYVAVTGFPEPQANHAIRMVKFAQGTH